MSATGRRPDTTAIEPLDLTRRETVATEVTRRLLSYLLSGDIRPGQKIPSERKLAEAYGVGRSVVREALKSLTLLGLVDVRQGDGTYLRATESDLLPKSIEWGLILGQTRTRDVIEARRYLEVVMAGLAANRRSDEDITVLRDWVVAMQHAAGDQPAFVAADLAFHLRLTQAAGNEMLGQVMSAIRTLLKVWITRVMDVPGSFDPSVAEHIAVLEAVEAGDEVAARAAMRAHMDAAYGRLEKTLNESALEVQPFDAVRAG